MTLYLVGKASDEHLRLSTFRFLIYVKIYELIIDYNTSIHKYDISMSADTFRTEVSPLAFRNRYSVIPNSKS